MSHLQFEIFESTEAQLTYTHIIFFFQPAYLSVIRKLKKYIRSFEISVNITSYSEDCRARLLRERQPEKF